MSKRPGFWAARDYVKLGEVKPSGGYRIARTEKGIGRCSVFHWQPPIGGKVEERRWGSHHTIEAAHFHILNLGRLKPGEGPVFIECQRVKA